MKKKLTIPAAVTKKVCIIGNLNIDLIIRNVAHMPEWGQEVFGDNYMAVSAGQSAYTAFALGKYNVPTGIISNVGDDVYGTKIIEDLGGAGIELSAIERVKNGCTGITVAVVRPDGERAFISDPSSLSCFNRESVISHIDKAHTASIAGIVGNFFLPGFTIEDIGYFFADFRTHGTETLLDTGWDSQDWPEETVRSLRGVLKHVDYFIPNMDEASALTGENDPEKAAVKLLSDGCTRVIIKLGAAGSYFKSEKEEYIVPAFSTEVLDAVGAGDVFNAGFIYGRLLSWPIDACMIFGSATASLYISRLTNRFPDVRKAIELANHNDKYEFREDKS